MQPDVIQKLLDLNQEFYQTFALHFSETRQRIQPGVLKAIKGMPDDASILDLGCGNGSLSNELARHGHRGRYVGMDNSQELLSIAASSSEHPDASFKVLDITSKGWSSDFLTRFDHVFAFAVLHHIPSEGMRLQVLHEISQTIKPDGVFTFSIWNFLESSRLRARIVSWEEYGMRADQLDDSDYLLDWRRGGYGLRYVHAFDEEELTGLAQRSGFSILDGFLSDGDGGRLGWYQVWKPR